MRMLSTVAAVCLFAAFLAVSTVSAGEFPTKNLTMIVPYATGGGTDVMARTVAQFMEAPLGKKVLVVNKPGAMGLIGIAEAMAARPDGYTMILMSSDFQLSTLLTKDPGFTLDDIKPIASFNDTASSIIAKAGTRFGSFADLVAYAKENPGRVTVACSGDAHLLLAAIIEEKAGIKLSTVTFASGGESLNAIMGGHVEIGLLDKRFIPQAEQAGCKTLGVSAPERFSILPDVPTLKEQGYDIADNQRRVLAVPAKTPQAVVDVLVKAILEFGNSQEFGDRLIALKEVRKIDTGDSLLAFLKQQLEEFKVVLEANRDKFPLE